ncbi:MAG: Na+/H+ antiporter NhaC family protein [Ignavibacteriaceae bacterium]
MQKYFFIISIFFLSLQPVFSQSISNPGIALEGIKFSVKINNLPSSGSIRILIKGEDYSKTLNAIIINGKVDTAVTVDETGDFDISLANINVPHSSIRILPGILSIIPPVLAIILALVFRQVIISLLFGVYIGVIFVFDYNPFTAILRLIDTYTINAISDTSHLKIIVFTLLFGGVVGLISKSGGTKGIANLVTKFARTKRSGQLATWASGILIFFDDYANTLIVGNLMRPITDKLKISREKLSFIVDATAAPVSSIFIVSSWIGYEVGLIHDSLATIHSNENAYNVFIQTIPYRFYPIMMLIFIFILAWLQRDFGPMYKAEKRAADEGKVLRDEAVVSKDLTETSEIFGNEDRAKWFNGVIPIVVLVLVTIAGLVYTGLAAVKQQGLNDYGLRDIIGNSDSYVALLWGSFLACIVAGIMILSQRIMNLSETVDAWFTGLRSMFLACIILTLAWSIGAITQDLRTADYIVNVISDTLNPHFLPVIVFLVCALISFSTGTSWGTMAIMMPIVIPLSHHVTELYHYSYADHMLILHGVISSVLAGSVFGDHCSPISDTTILSSMASACDHIDHVRTQLPYAVVTAILCMLIGDIPTAFGFSPYFSILIISACLALILYFFGKKVSYKEAEPA